MPPFYKSPPGDLAARDRDILARLNLPALAAAAGLTFAGPPSGPWHPCHAAGRTDRTPSASLNADTGVYKDHGSGDRRSFWDLLVLLGAFPDWRAARDHHAAAVGLPAGPAGSRDEQKSAPAVRSRRVRRPAAPVPNPRVSAVARDCRSALTPQRLNALSSSVGLPADAFDKLGVGWCDRRGVWTFPMKAADGALRGLRTRTPAGAKRAVTGSRDGLFLPDAWTDSPPDRPDRLVIAEGPTDTAALLAWGFAAAGRPSAHGAAGIVGDLCRRLSPDEAVILADADEAGRKGADALAAGLLVLVPVVRVCEPPAGVKDARAWFLRGESADEAAALFDAAPPRRLRIRRGGKGVGQ
ncbi:toprim domain-containing protein [Alienimonas californiensis]|uniref:Toprim domain-containing protein n=1 Tax=Alienimonas californiensis TaxID=2527989 RepID=A0A517P8N1_9PLAN|nr:toprim domain-containing protein [Alienimonas californiensis]QDT15730.1 hypothetical protein CA12_18220 [Alienimonas californiensis]